MKTGQKAEHITPVEAAEIYRKLTGKYRSVKTVIMDVHKRPHLALWAVSDVGGAPLILKGIKRKRWEYFLKIRMSMYEEHQIFHENEI